MEFFSIKGIRKIKDAYDGQEELGRLSLRVDVNGESFFLTENPLNDFGHIALDCAFGSEFTFSLHQNEKAVPIILNPIEDLSCEFMDWIAKKLSLHLCSVKLSESCVVSYSHFKELVDNRVEKEKSFFAQLRADMRISTDPLA